MLNGIGNGKHDWTRAALRAIGGGALALALVTASPGCAVPAVLGVMAENYKKTGTHEVLPEYDGLQGKTFAVIVSVDRVTQANQPTLVPRLTNAITSRLATNAGASGFVPGERVLMFQYNTPQWTSWDYSRIANEFTVDRLIIVEVLEYRLNEPGNSYLWEGLVAGRFGVVEADSFSPEDFTFVKDVTVRFPNDKGVTRADMPQQVVQTRLETRFIDRTTWLTYAHQEPFYPEY